MPIVALDSPDAVTILAALEERRGEASDDAMRVAGEVIAGVRSGGDRYAARQIETFDRVKLDPNDILTEVAPPPATALDPGLTRAIDTAIERIESFHLRQLPASYRWTRGDTVIEHRVGPLRRVGIYVPGGRAVYISTLIMCAVPARIAGVGEIVVATTPAAAARPEFQYVCGRLGVREVYRAGGAAGIAALALGTETLERVDKIVGPGNSYVTAAKALLNGTVGIDMIAGPTELVIIADDSAIPETVAADLLAQSEHGPDSAVICVCTSQPVASAIAAFITPVPNGGPVLLFTASVDSAIALANRIAPEHLSIQTRGAAGLAAKAVNCGAIFCGPFSAPAAGDYVIGSNHVLPTAGTARFDSPLGVYDFVKRSNVIIAGENDANDMAPLAERIAQFEGLPLHGRSVKARQKVRS
jgi:histidinol dehydrogenase